MDMDNELDIWTTITGYGMISVYECVCVGGGERVRGDLVSAFSQKYLLLIGLQKVTNLAVSLRI